jgi:hypothetical protein
LLGVDPATLFHSYHPPLQLFLTNGGAIKSKYVLCMRSTWSRRNYWHADGSSWMQEAWKTTLIEHYKIVPNADRGPFFWEFRNVMLANMRLDKPTVQSFNDPTKSQSRSTIPTSNPFSQARFVARQVQMLWNSFSAKAVVVWTRNMGKLSLPEQIQIVKQSAMFVRVIIGGAASTYGHAFGTKRVSRIVL